MNNQRILILGGYGNVGKLLARLLLQETTIRLVLAGRSIEKAESAAAQFNSLFAGNRVTSTHADASDVASLNQAFEGVDLVVVGSSTAKYAREVATVALEAGIDYLDVQYSTKKIAILKSLLPEIREAGRCFIADAGFHPGLPAALIRYVAQHFDSLEKATVGSVIKVDWASLAVVDATIYEFLEEMNEFESLVFEEGQWKKARILGMMDYITMDFGGEFGEQYCVPMFLEEMAAIPDQYPTLKETGFFVGGFNWFVDWLVFPSAVITLKIWPQRAMRPMGRLMKWGLTTFSRPPYGTLLKVEATGRKDRQAKAMNVTLYHEDGYMFTAIPVAACLLQYLDGSIKKPGLWTQANIVEPNRLVKDMERMGVAIQTKGESGGFN